jgi:hypothetical protein
MFDGSPRGRPGTSASADGFVQQLEQLLSSWVQLAAPLQSPHGTECSRGATAAVGAGW